MNDVNELSTEEKLALLRHYGYAMGNLGYQVGILKPSRAEVVNLLARAALVANSLPDDVEAS